mmetsp:Transcript_1791/g.2681  ORF Transcript_1791/g.2681 Transcript_1791/m.2681 type:complete len:135 (+) Transcript_1791:102-506(+)
MVLGVRTFGLKAMLLSLVLAFLASPFIVADDVAVAHQEVTNLEQRILEDAADTDDDEADNPVFNFMASKKQKLAKIAAAYQLKKAKKAEALVTKQYSSILKDKKSGVCMPPDQTVSDEELQQKVSECVQALFAE